MHKGLTALALGTFALGIAEFTMMGILGDVARELGVSIVKAGHLISAYSAGVAVGAPMLIWLRKWPLHRTLLFLAAFIAAGNAAAALSPNYFTLMCSRFISGLPHGAFFGAGAIVCTRLAGAGSGPAAVAVMVGGMTVANVIGVPAATFVSNVLSWRVAFGIVALFGVASFAAVKLYVPRLAALPDTGIKGQFRFLRSPAPWLIYAGVFFGQMSVYCYLSYIEPVMTQVVHFGTDSMSRIMIIAGLGMVAGNIAAGRLAGRYGSANVSCAIALVIMAVMPAIYFSTDSKTASVMLMFVATACLFGIGGPLQYLIVKFAKGGEMLGGAGIQIAFNVSNAVAAVLGGVAIEHGGPQATALAGIPAAFVGAVALYILSHKYKTLAR